MSNKNNLVYVVIMYRWGDREKHSYLLGVYDNEDVAIKEGVKETAYRGGKYESEIYEIELNKPITKKTIKKADDYLKNINWDIIGGVTDGN
ncbi:MAG: hypothetical protein ACOCZ5_01345 [bacterium]